MGQTLAEWASIAEIIGAIVVMVSLVFVGFEIRRNTVATQAATLQSSVSNDTQILTTVGATEQASYALYRYSFDPSKLSEAQLVQGRRLFASAVRHWENLYLQYRAGTLSEAAWTARQPAANALVLCLGWDEYLGSLLGHFMGGPIMEYAERVRASSSERLSA